MKKAYFFENDYCSRQILPLENYKFCIQEILRIEKSVYGHANSVGFAEVTEQMVPPYPLEQKKISLEKLLLCFINAGLEQLIVYSEYDYFQKPCKSQYAYGINENLVVFYEANDIVITAIWMNLIVKNENEFMVAKRILHEINKLGSLLIVDWNRGFTTDLSNDEQIIQYLKLA